MYVCVCQHACILKNAKNRACGNEVDEPNLQNVKKKHRLVIFHYATLQSMFEIHTWPRRG